MSSTRSLRAVAAGALAVAMLAGAMPARADDDWRHRREREWRAHQRQREWREQRWREERPVYVAPPPPVVYAPPPPAGITLFFPIHIR
jgi:hypothetical protein